ncbi:MAG: YHS domain-containing protein [Blastocatellia bacterium]
MANQIDLVCGTPISAQTNVQSEYLGQIYYFCSEGCKHKFDQRPEDYLVKGQSSSIATDP